MVKKLLFSVLALAASWAISAPAQASADSTCYPEWKVKQTEMRGCSGMALLSPGNDTRINLLMLLHDRHGDVGVSHANSYDMMERRGDAQPFDYGIFALALGKAPSEDDNYGGGGDRCISNDGGQKDFEKALASAKGLTAAERAQLLAARQSLQPQCADEGDLRAATATAVQGVGSAAAKGFASYLLGAAAFYDGDFAGARLRFQDLAKDGAGWTREAATYMLGRVALNVAMQNAFDDYGAMREQPTNGPDLDMAEKNFKSYLQAYPQGRYAASARGLLRKVYWLGGQNDALLAEYAAAFKRGNLAGGTVSLADLVQEMDVKLGDKLDRGSVSDPAILAMLDLQAMRHSDDREDGDRPPISRGEIDAQKPRFAGNEALFAYVQAAHALFVAKDAEAALRLLPAHADGDGYLAYSQRALRALALDTKGDPGARAALYAVLEGAKKPFQRGSMELALAMHDERHAALERVFAPDSPVKDADVREILLRYTAPPKLLRARAGAKDASAQERNVALYTLLYKQLTRGAYKDFLADQSLVPIGAKRIAEDDYTTPAYANIAIFRWSGAKDGYVCPSLATLATALSGAPKDAPSLLCLGEFVRLNGLDTGGSWPDVSNSLDDSPPKDQLGGTPSLFPGKRFSRLEAYKAVIANPAADANSKAYALYRAVYCYAPSGFNSCGGVEVPIAQRKAWFNQLRKSFPASPWAAKLKYYW